MSGNHACFGRAFCSYEPAPGGSKKWRTYRISEAGIFDSIHKGLGLTPAMIADGIREMCADETHGDSMNDFAVFHGNKLVAIIHTDGPTVVVETLNNSPVKPSRRRPSRVA